MASANLRLREEPLSIPRSTKKQWNASTKLTETKKPTGRKQAEDLEDFSLQAHELVSRAIDGVLNATPVSMDKNHASHKQSLTAMYVKEIEHAIEQDERICNETRTKMEESIESIEVDLHLEQIRLEKARRKVAIQAFRRQIQRQMQRLTEMANEIDKREQVMDAAFDQYENLILCHRQDKPHE